MFNKADTQRRLRVIRLTIQAGSFTKHSKKELSLINFHDDQKMHTLTRSSQKLREKYGLDAIKWGSELPLP